MTVETPGSALPAARKLGPFYLMPGITRINGASYFLTAMLLVPLMAAFGFLQPLILRLVGVEREVQGTLSGDLVFYQEVIVLLLTPFVGAMADKAGRRPLIMLGVALLGISYAVYPFADSIFKMYAYRTVFGVGLALVATTITVINTDYVQDRSRGRWIALASMTQGTGIFIATQLLRRLPSDLAGKGYSEADIALYLFWGCSGVCILVFCIAAFGLSPGRPAEVRDRDSAMTLVRAGLRAGMENGRIALAYATAFAARGDVLVVGAFGFLWTQHAAEDLGLGAAEGFRRGGMIVGVIQAAALCWALVMGWLLDKVDRVTGVIIAFSLAAAGYLSFGFIDDPFSNSIFLPAVLLGMGEASTIICGNALIGQAAPPTFRGAVLGSFALFGAVGILVCTIIGGRLFDMWMPGGPFVLMGIVNALVLAFAIAVRLRAAPHPA